MFIVQESHMRHPRDKIGPDDDWWIQPTKKFDSKFRTNCSSNGKIIRSKKFDQHNRSSNPEIDPWSGQRSTSQVPPLFRISKSGGHGVAVGEMPTLIGKPKKHGGRFPCCISQPANTDRSAQPININMSQLWYLQSALME